MNRHKILLPLLFIVVISVLASGCSSVKEMSSEVPTPAPVVDGKAGEWEGKLYIFKEDGLLVGVQDDSVDLYVCVEGLDRATSQSMMRGGVTVKLDPGTGDSSFLGIHFGGRGRMMRQNEDALFHPMTESSIEILGKKNNVVMMIPAISSDREYGIQIALRDSGGAAVFEMKFPRKYNGRTFGLTAVPDKRLAMEVDVVKGRAGTPPQTNEGKTEEPGGEEGGIGEGRMGRGMRGGRRGEGEGERGERRMASPESTSLSLRVRLNFE